MMKIVRLYFELTSSKRIIERKKGFIYAHAHRHTHTSAISRYIKK